MKSVRVVAALDRRGISASVARLRARRDVDLELVSGAARAASSVWQRKAALVIFELGASDADAAPAAGAGALDAIHALRSEPTTAALPILLVVPAGRPDLREQGFKAGASDVCWSGGDPRGFEESLLHLAGIPIRRHPRRPASIPVRIAGDDDTWRAATALNLSAGGLQLKWDSPEVPVSGKVLKVELEPTKPAFFAAVQGGTRTGGALLTRLRFVGLSTEERARIDALVAALPGPDEPEPELTPVPDEGPPDLPRRRFAPTRAMWAIAIGAILLATGLAAHYLARGPLEEPSRAALTEH
ncbi:MAG TPA: PilZ domain-containing protein [bacterium]|nr:PilZ domain-containing protein [bacterium]